MNEEEIIGFCAQEEVEEGRERVRERNQEMEDDHVRKRDQVEYDPLRDRDIGTWKIIVMR